MAAAQTASAPVVIVPEEVELGSSNTVWRRFRRHRLALVGLAVLAVFCFAALFAEWVALKSPYYVDIDNIKAPPAAVGGQIPARAVATMGHAAGMLELLTLLLGVVPAALRSRRALVLENLLLRHQLAVLTRPARKRPAIRRRDRLVWILARRLCHDWRRSLVVVRPETVVAWHRRGWRLFWWWRSRCPAGRPRLSAGVRALIATMSRDYPLWGAERIRGELLELGIVVSKRSIRRSRGPREPRPPSQTWRAFLTNHRPRIWAADVLTVRTMTFRTL